MQNVDHILLLEQAVTKTCWDYCYPMDGQRMLGNYPNYDDQFAVLLQGVQVQSFEELSQYLRKVTGGNLVALDMFGGGYNFNFLPAQDQVFAFRIQDVREEHIEGGRVDDNQFVKGIVTVSGDFFDPSYPNLIAEAMSKNSADSINFAVMRPGGVHAFRMDPLEPHVHNSGAFISWCSLGRADRENIIDGYNQYFLTNLFLSLNILAPQQGMLFLTPPEIYRFDDLCHIARSIMLLNPGIDIRIDKPKKKAGFLGDITMLIIRTNSDPIIMPDMDELMKLRCPSYLMQFSHSFAQFP